MSFKVIKTFYWTTFVLSIVILPLNIGLGLIGLGIVILPVLILHLAIGLGLNGIQSHKTSIILSATNLLAFALIRPDGVHAVTDSGLTSLLDIFGVHGVYNHKYESYFFVVSLILLFLQVVMDMRLRKLKKAGDRERSLPRNTFEIP